MEFQELQERIQTLNMSTMYDQCTKVDSHYVIQSFMSSPEMASVLQCIAVNGEDVARSERWVAEEGSSCNHDRISFLREETGSAHVCGRQ